MLIRLDDTENKNYIYQQYNEGTTINIVLYRLFFMKLPSLSHPKYDCIEAD